MSKFIHDDIFNSSHKMGKAKISYEKAVSKFPNHNSESADGKVECSWNGKYIANDNTEVRASFWDWNGGLRAGYGVSIWVEDPKYLQEFKSFIEA